jgi:hypothetical protein
METKADRLVTQIAVAMPDYTYMILLGDTEWFTLVRSPHLKIAHIDLAHGICDETLLGLPVQRMFEPTGIEYKVLLNNPYLR